MLPAYVTRQQSLNWRVVGLLIVVEIRCKVLPVSTISSTIITCRSVKGIIQANGSYYITGRLCSFVRCQFYKTYFCINGKFLKQVGSKHERTI